MAQITIKTIGGEMIDAIAHEHYKGQSGATAEVLKANLSLSRYGPILPADVEIILPELPEVKEEVITLWD